MYLEKIHNDNLIKIEQEKLDEKEKQKRNIFTINQRKKVKKRVEYK